MVTDGAFVCAATGVQGGAVARQLRALDWEVHTTTRDPSSTAAQALASAGVKVHQGSWDNTAALEAAIAGCDCLFLNLVPVLTDFSAEFRLGRSVLRIAKAAGVKHVVYSTGYRFPHMGPTDFMAMAFQPKLDLEQELQSAGFRVEILYPGAAETGVFTTAMRHSTTLIAVDHDDIGAFAVAAFQNLDIFHGQIIDLISETITFENALEIMHRRTGRNLRARYLLDEELVEAKKTNPLLVLQKVMRDFTLDRDVKAEARKWGIETGSFERFVEREERAFDETYADVESF
ncbi:NAD(P)-binding protein [Parathielavia hyrcaniae]|uniref:NAD(P)-binding protein n=1 Tax=Parathielavia hyrcaniae TaxID=113614 RepID=A0AAN6PWB0_9PEZI|nr:NAD(P)-binding protein [Parathielavia hyrcaniae]